MSSPREALITGIGIVSPIGIGRQAVWQSLIEQRSGVRPLKSFDVSAVPIRFGAEVIDFDSKEMIKPRKSLKVMSRDIQMGFVAADLALKDAGLAEQSVDPERVGVLFGTDMIHALPEEVQTAFRNCLVEGRFDFNRWGPSAMAEVYPLWMLKHLPNMPACHIAIAHDARGPNNSITLGEVSSLLALSEAMRVIERGQADMIICGGTGTRVHPVSWVRSCAGSVSHRSENPSAASRPFDADRDGLVNGEGAAAFIVESRDHAERRHANVRARILGYASTFEPRSNGQTITGDAIRRSIAGAIKMSGLTPAEIGHVNPHGLSTRDDDRAEAQAIRSVLDDVPVTAPKSYFGNLGSGTGAVELAATLLAFEHNLVPVTLNYERPDPQCPVSVVHREPLSGRPATAVVLNQTPMGQAAAVVLAGPS